MENEKDCIHWCVVVDCCKSCDRNYLRGNLPGARRRKGLWFIVFDVTERRLRLRRHMHGCRNEMGGVGTWCKLISAVEWLKEKLGFHVEFWGQGKIQAKYNSGISCRKDLRRFRKKLRPLFHSFQPGRDIQLVSPSAGRLGHESPSAQLSASLRMLHFISPLRVCVRAPTRGPMSLRGKHCFKIRSLTVEGPPRCSDIQAEGHN